ncbi:hypothetical protein FP803_03875 [Candidatus Woesearchaeota archaeon]|nr:hypothetical protein [Candidatus Woesearchaeota archaeon]
MKLILDNNILFSLMKPDSVNSYLFSILKVEFCAPEYIKSEFEKYKSDCLFKSQLSEHEFKIRQTELEGDIKFFKLSEYKSFLKKAIGSLSDPDDSPYIALALSINASIWSNDSHLKQQSLVKVFTTAELIEKLLKNEL